ncbi:S1C family serine protease [Hanstruepera marina]|uniref:S1C family serine protease n=1 Tax=Hanstruepera marina TaxID=2873265 RepID=UPI001CA6B812|nr:trypsin-like peptidase domain-containing protein [Hanstruepera marina]
MRLLFFFFLGLFTTTLAAQDLSEIYNKVSPAVVVIYTSEQQIVPDSNHISHKVSQNGLGSGFMISDRLIVTAAHVVTVPEDIKVLFPDGDVIPAKVVSFYKSADIALIKLFRPRINPVTVSFGDSDALKIGERIFVIGAPFGLDASLSSGYVSSFRRSNAGMSNPFTTTDFIQTDAAINQGNSGGPMFNLKGEVVGIVSQIITQSGGSDGIGYATSSNLAARLLLNDNLPWVGADMHTLTPQEAMLLNVPQSSGILVQRVVEESIFGKMGVQGGTVEGLLGNKKLILGGDVILSINGITFNTDEKTLEQLAQLAQSLNDNVKLTLEVLRQGKRVTLKQ